MRSHASRRRRSLHGSSLSWYIVRVVAVIVVMVRVVVRQRALLEVVERLVWTARTLSLLVSVSLDCLPSSIMLYDTSLRQLMVLVIDLIGGDMTIKASDDEIGWRRGKKVGAYHRLVFVLFT
jgi:hypothetical protein